MNRSRDRLILQFGHGQDRRFRAEGNKNNLEWRSSESSFQHFRPLVILEFLR